MPVHRESKVHMRAMDKLATLRDQKLILCSCGLEVWSTKMKRHIETKAHARNNKMLAQMDAAE